MVVERVSKVKNAGNRIRADYVSLDTDLSIKLADARAIKTNRLVPRQYILEMNRDVSILIPELLKRSVIDELYLWDTNINGSPRLILKQINGKITIANRELYNEFLKKSKY